MELLEKITNLIQPVLTSLNGKISEISLSYEEGSHYLHVFVSRNDGPVDLNYIVKLTEIISPLLDEADFLPYQYILDIGSAGAETPLEISELGDYVNTNIAVTLKTALKRLENVQGTLVSVEENSIHLKINNKGRIQTIEIEKNNLAKVRKAIKF